jgi:hypothetical protein
VQHSSTTNNAAANGTGASELADDDLPSVMTCANYLKLPPYSTKVFSFGILVKQECMVIIYLRLWSDGLVFLV